MSDLLVGYAGRAVGLKGEIEVQVISDAPDRFAPGSTLLVGEKRRELTVRTSRKQKDRVVVSFDGIEDRTGAEALRGASIAIESTAARRLEEGEFWDHDLVGCVVVTTDGRELGTVSDVLHQPSGELLAVGDHLIPLIKNVVLEVVPGERITIDPLPGLLD